MIQGTKNSEDLKAPAYVRLRRIGPFRSQLYVMGGRTTNPRLVRFDRTGDRLPARAATPLGLGINNVAHNALARGT